MKFDLVVVGAGLSSRAGGNKLKFSLGNTTVLERSIGAFLSIKNIEKIVVVLRSDDLDFGNEIKENLRDARIVFAIGGSSRAESVLNGLRLCSSPAVLVHDGARPFVSEDVINRVMDSVETYGSGVPALPISDSVRQVKNNDIIGEFDRSELYSVQTPQGFLLEDLLKSYENGMNFTDESLLYTSFVRPARIVEGSERNVKLTTSGDLTALNAKVGIGYDLHKLGLFRKLMLGGIEIPYEFGEIAHSDGDVIIHAIIDAILGAIGERDIGTLFPDNDPQYLDADSAFMLAEVMDICRRKNFKIMSVNAIVILEKPKLCDYIPVMKVKLARIMEISPENVTISAKTNECVGDIGTGLAVAAYATVTVL